MKEERTKSYMKLEAANSHNKTNNEVVNITILRTKLNNNDIYVERKDTQFFGWLDVGYIINKILVGEIYITNLSKLKNWNGIVKFC